MDCKSIAPIIKLQILYITWKPLKNNFLIYSDHHCKRTHFPHNHIYAATTAASLLPINFHRENFSSLTSPCNTLLAYYNYRVGVLNFSPPHFDDFPRLNFPIYVFRKLFSVSRAPLITQHPSIFGQIPKVPRDNFCAVFA